MTIGNRNLRLPARHPSHICYTRRMSSIASRELRNSTRGLLDRVDRGEEITITVDGRPVARLTPMSTKPGSMGRDEFLRRFHLGRIADPAFDDDIADIVGDETTDDIDDPWQHT